MAGILTTSHFLIRPYRITGQEANADFLDFIQANEQRLLKDLLGIEFYNVAYAGMIANVDARWIAMRTGAEYDYADVTFKYEGIFDLLIPMIYSLWLAETFDRHTAAGIVVAKPAESDMVSPARRISKANVAYFKKVGDACNQENTLYGFLYANRATYPEWDESRWCPRGRVNILGL